MSDILGTWFDEAALKVGRLEEQRELFGEKGRAYVRSRKVGFVFVAGWEAGLTQARDACTRLGLDATVFAHIRDNNIPFTFENCLAGMDADAIQEFKDKCFRIGAALVEAKSPEVVRERALGYGNRAMLLVSRYNVPSQVLDRQKGLNGKRC